MNLKLHIKTKIRSKQRPRIGAKGVYTPKQTKEYETEIAWHVKACMLKNGLYSPMNGLIGADIKFILKNNRKIDIDNCVKAVLDACNGLAYNDDSQIVFMRAYKLYNPHDEEGISIEIFDFSNEFYA
jgi:Holliday junction resolvase RusA-like endonuclease